MASEIADIVNTVDDDNYKKDLSSNTSIIDNITGDHRIDKLPYLLTMYKILIYTGHGNAIDYLKAYSNDFLYWN